jgi:DeoR family glycerol-3-phosphate regulon repressor
MTQGLRHPDILEMARREGRVTVEGLAAHFGVTVQTIRRDLADLARAGRLERVHGGAILPSGYANIGYRDRRDMARDAKSAIADAAVRNIPDGASVFLGIGTSTEAVAHALRQHRDLLILTNNLNVAQIFQDHPSSETVVTGGALRRADRGLVGPITTRVIEQFRVDIAVIGCSALDAGGDLLDFDIQEVAVSQTVLRCARAAFLVADSSKFDRTAPVRVAALRELAGFFTDRPPPGDLEARCASWATELHVARPAGQAPEAAEQPC